MELQAAANSPADVRIRLIRESDVSGYKAIRLEALRNHPTAFGTDYAESAAKPDSFWLERVREAIDQPTGCIVLAEIGQELVGMSGIFRSGGVKREHSGTIWGVYVRQEYRGRGIGSAMIERLIEWGRERGVAVARLTVESTNESIRCYLKCGFCVYGVSPAEIRIGERYHDEILMWRRV